MKKIILIVLYITSNLAYSQWIEIKTPDISNVISIAAMDNHLFAATNNSLLYYSIDNGDNWSKVESIDSLLINSIDKIFAIDNKFFLINKNNLYLSEDYCKTFVKLEISKKISEITSINYFDNTLYIAADSYLFTSIDLGINWIQVKLYNGTDPINSINRINNKIYVATGKGLYFKDIDSNNYVLLDYPQINIKNIIKFQNDLFLETAQGIYKSIDSGKHWKIKPIQFENPYLLKLYNFNNNLLLLYRDSLFSTTNNGDSWDFILKNDSLSRINELYFYFNQYFFATSNGIFTSNNLEQLVNKNKNINSINVNNIVNYKNELILLTSNKEIYKTSTNDINWKLVKKVNLSSYINNLYFENENTLLLATHKGVYYIDLLDSSKYEVRNNGIMGHKDSINSKSIFKHNNIILTNTNYGLYKSSDDGLNWIICDSLLINKNIISITLFQNKILALDTQNKIYISDVNALNWEIKELPSNSKGFNLITSNNDFIFIANESELLRSSNLGDSWYQISKNQFTNLSQLKTINNYLIAINFNKVYISKNNGINWDITIDSLPKLFRIEKLYISKDSVNTFLTTNKGLYKANIEYLDLNEQVESPLMNTYIYIYPPYPNPAKKEISFPIFWDPIYDIKLAKISVFDINGMKIDTKNKITLTQNEPYKGNIILNCDDFKNGIYLLQIKHGSGSRVTKFIIYK